MAKERTKFSIADRASWTCALVLLSVALLACAPLERRQPRAAQPAPDVWAFYSGTLYGHRRDASGAAVVEDTSDGFLPAFRIRLRRGEREPEVAALRAGAGDANRGAAMLAALARLQLPPGDRGRWFATYRDNARWTWRHRRIAEGAPHVALHIDLRAVPASAAAELCRSVEVSPVRRVTGERCRIEAVLDPADGWPLVAEIERSMSGADGAMALETVTFERLTPEQAGAVPESR